MCEIAFVVVFLCRSLLNPDLFLSVVLHFSRGCAILTHLCLLRDNINHFYSICFDHSAENLLFFCFMLVTVYLHRLSDCSLFIKFIYIVCNSCLQSGLFTNTLQHSAVLSSPRPDLGLCPALSATRAVPLLLFLPTSPLCPHLSWAMNKKLTPNCQPATRHALQPAAGVATSKGTAPPHTAKKCFYLFLINKPWP